MSNQLENEKQPLTPEEVRQALLAELKVSKQVIAELSDEELAEVQGGTGAEFLGIMIRGDARYARENGILLRTQSAPPRLESAPFRQPYTPFPDSPLSDLERGQGVMRVRPVDSPTHAAAQDHPHHP